MAETATPYDGMVIRCDDSDLYYAMHVNEALGKIASRPLGASLLKSIHKRAHKANFGYTVCIKKPNGAHGMTGDDGKIVNSWGNIAIRVSEAKAIDGTGTQTVVKWNPNLIQGDGSARPPFIALAHELIHAMNNLRGTAFSDTRTEEMKTVGLGEHANDRKRNENAIRGEHHLALRTQYTGLYP